MSGALVGQTGIGGANDTSPQTLAYSSSPGNILVIAGHLSDTDGFPELVSIRDDAGNVWYYETGSATVQAPPYAYLNDQAAIATRFLNLIAWTYQDKGPVTEVIISRFDTTSNWWRVALGEFSGIGAFSNSAAAATPNGGAGATTFAPGTVVVGSGALVVASVDVFFGTISGASGFSDFSASAPGDLQYYIGPPTGNYAPTWDSTATDLWAGAIAVFLEGKVATAGAATGAGNAISGVTIASAGVAQGAGTAAPAAIPGAGLAVTPGAAAGAGQASPGSFAGPSTGAASGTLGPYLYPQITSSNTDTAINNNVWNGGAAPGWVQVLTAVSPGKWDVEATITNTSGAVVSYPDVEQPYYEKPLSRWRSIVSSWSESMTTDPSVDMAEAAFDIWLNNFGNEVMIWVDITPLQKNTLNFDTYLGQVNISGQLLDYWHGGGANEIIYALHTNQPTGTVDVLGVLQHAEANSLIPANSNLTAIEFGWEISTTNGVPRTFTITQFSITEEFPMGSAMAAGTAAPPAVTTHFPVPGIMPGVFP